jgi:hypothetical protein
MHALQSAALSDLETITPVDPLLADPILDDGDHDRFSHYARKSDIVESAVTGKPVVALCGKVWVPGRNPDRFPVCPTCREIYEKRKADELGA